MRNKTLKASAHILIFSLFISTSLSNTAAANMTRYQTPFEQAIWTFNGDQFSCQIEHKITGFGSMKMEALPGETLRLELTADWLTLNQTQSSIKITPPAWKKSHTALGETQLIWHGNKATSNTSINPFLEALEQGFAWQAIIDGRETASYLVSSSPVNTGQVANQFRLCRHQLLPKPFSYVRSVELLFSSGSSQITMAHETDLDAITQYVKADSSITQVLVDAHADNNGEHLANLVLSKERADEVAARLVELGLPKGLIQVRHHGAREPKVSNKTQDGRDANRRVMIRLIKRPNKIATKRTAGVEYGS